jgi:hypothetical protein
MGGTRSSKDRSGCGAARSSAQFKNREARLGAGTAHGAIDFSRAPDGYTGPVLRHRRRGGLLARRTAATRGHQPRGAATALGLDLECNATKPGLHYLCAGYKKSFRHVRRYMRAMTTLMENDLPVSLVMKAIDGPLIVPRKSPGP